MLHSLFRLTLLFYALFNSLGSLPVFVALLKKFSFRKQQRIILRESIYALLLLFLFITFGRSFFRLLGITLPAFQLTGGLLLGAIAIDMMKALPPHTEALKQNKEEPVFFPLAFPIITGPAMITSTLGHMEEGIFSKEVVLGAILLAWLFSLITLLLSSPINRLFGQMGLLALERLFSISLALMSVNLILKAFSTAFNIGYYVMP
ncbi:MarC family protein [Chlamydia sp.]|uniref:MarC family protein n=1 Tax=Chlamydia sp. TaxID=35827 RepID=UPI0025C0C328|nr:MarC family protein [Chlamydia sp.]MBQ8498500.1 MarC family protein [Chlamydia sp.]